MTSTTRFVQPTWTVAYTPNYISTTATSLSVSNYRPAASGSLTIAEANSLVAGGVAAALAEASASFVSDPQFTALFGDSEAIGIGIEDSYFGKSDGKTKVIGTFNITNEQPLSFDFAMGIDIEAKEIDKPDAEYNRGKATTAFLVLDTSRSKSKVLGYYGVQGDLISSEQNWTVTEGKRKGVKRSLSQIDLNVAKNIDGNDGVDVLRVNVSGNYEQTFEPQISKVTVVQVTKSVTKFRGDTLIGNLGEGVTYGTIQDNTLKGSDQNDILYGSLGADELRGKKGDDILEGGLGNDKLWGNEGNNKLHGSEGDDILYAGPGSDLLAGGAGADHFVFDRLKAGERHTILDFEVGIDKIKKLGKTSGQRAFNNVLQSFTDTPLGAQFTAKTGAQVLFSGLSIAELGSADGLFA
ncbi:MAG: calcium-binding protein [Phormidesmis sp. RL_2_1]|nr:calcium-binding protein [Phormidesmis sp. RL_2_1]